MENGIIVPWPSVINFTDDKMNNPNYIIEVVNTFVKEAKTKIFRDITTNFTIFIKKINILRNMESVMTPIIDFTLFKATNFDRSIINNQMKKTIEQLIQYKTKYNKNKETLKDNKLTLK